MAGKKVRSPESMVREIRRKTRRRFSVEEKIRIVLDGLKGESSCAAEITKQPTFEGGVMKVTLVGLVFLAFVASSALGQELTTAESFLTSAG